MKTAEQYVEEADTCSICEPGGISWTDAEKAVQAALDDAEAQIQVERHNQDQQMRAREDQIKIALQNIAKISVLTTRSGKRGGSAFAEMAAQQLNIAL